ncbi:MAG: polysaccharide biosynthesis/export family protein [Vampirovibrionales bacterium]|nr:polysaccharide biosynthesis/export family protein [Vampirovibrionales bacterium]
MLHANKWFMSCLMGIIMTQAVFTTVPAFSQELEQTPVIETGTSTAPIKAKVSYNISNSYKIGVGDVLSLAVYPQEEFSADNLLVRSDGAVTFPKIGEFSAYGKSVKELTSEINAQLGHSLRNHQVTINVTSTRPAIFYLTGAFNKQGPFQMSTNSHDQNNGTDAYSRRFDQVLSNVIANSGGLTLNADLSRVQIKHRDSGNVEVVNLWKVIREGSSEDDPWLDPGDTVHVPTLPQGAIISDEEFKILANSTLAPTQFPVRVVGEVMQPNLVRLSGDSPLLSSAIVMAGGYGPQATKNAVAIRRFIDDNHFTTLFVNPEKMDFILRPNDVVYVAENKFYKAGRYMERLNMVLSPFTSTANAVGMMGYGGWNNGNR